MNRTGLLIALAIAIVTGLLFGFYPGLDIAVAGYFHAFEDNNHNMFALRLYAPLMRMRDAGLWIGTALVAPAVGALIIKLLLPRRKMLMSGRAVMFLIATMALAPGLLVNAVLKDHWGRPRPIDVTQFGGNQNFVAWWDPRGDCPSNCAFVSGDVAGAAWTIAPAALAPPPWRALAYAAALTLSAGMAAIRVMAGAHFPSDVIFAGVFTFLIIWITYAVVYRWRRTRFSDDDVEQALEWVAMPGYNLIAGLFGAGRKSK
jgi:membrane-associated PAP2 superfamily phosphatase